MYSKYIFYYNYLLKCDILVEFKTYFKYKRLELIKYIFLDYIVTLFINVFTFTVFITNCTKILTLNKLLIKYN